MPLPTKELVTVCRQLATAYDAGIPITRALELAGNNSGHKATRETLQQMSLSIRNGATLGEAARAEQRQLPPLLIEMLATGEHGGRLDMMLRELADYFESRQRLQRRVASMMTLPVLYLVAAWFLGSFALGIARNLRFDERNPFNLGDYFESYLRFQGISLVLFGIAAAVLIALHRAGALARFTDSIGRFLWPFNEMTRKFALARFFRAFALLVTSGLNIRQCIERAAAVAHHPRIARDLLQAVPLVGEGRSLTQSFALSTTLTPTAREMIAIGEESGELDKMLHKAAEYHEAEASHALDRTIKILGVLIMLAVGAMIGYIVISFWASYFNLLSSIG